MRAALILSMLLLGAGCRGKPSPPPTDAPQAVSVPVATASSTQTAQPTAPAAPNEDAVHACTKDDDCVNSCRHGAVSRSWWEASYPGGEPCEDGCTSKGTDPPKCRQGHCAAYFQGKPSAECTLKNESVIPGPGPAHRCQSDADCRMSCRYGAVNAQWYTYGAKGECKDGCAMARHARCDSGACVAMRGNQVDERCTKRPIYAPP